MALMQGKNLWGSAAGAGQGFDQIRGDLFLVNMTPPTILGNLGWNDSIAFAVTKFPFPARDRESIAIKYLQQTNHQIGADTPMAAITIPVRWSFNKPTIQLLEQWSWATSNPNGAVALTSEIKTNGVFYWLAPNTSAALTFDNSNPDALAGELFTQVSPIILEGCWVKGLKYSDADMESSNNVVTAEFNLQIDRYYPQKTSDLVANVS